MISKDDVFSFILNEYKVTGKPVSLTKIKRKFKDKTIEEILMELEKDEKVRKYKISGRVIYEPLFKQDSIMEELKILRDEIHKIYDLLQKIIDLRNVSYREFDETYERIKDSLGYAPLERIRIELGLTKEEFYSKFRKYIEENYDLIAGGEEGFIRKGSIYGIIKRRR